MWISSLKLNNIKSFEELNISLAKNINILIGANNSGKSTILQSIYLLQEPNALELTDLRIGSSRGSVSLKPEYGDEKLDLIPYDSKKIGSFTIEFNSLMNKINRLIYESSGEILQSNAKHANKARPNNLIFTHLSQRKVVQYDQSVDMNMCSKVFDDYRSLPSKINLIRSPKDEHHSEFHNHCLDILDFVPDSLDTLLGKNIGILVNDKGTTIPITKMGQGIPSILALLYDLCHAKNQIFLIEELENDLHPLALKKLLSIIIGKSQCNQFFISTHSNIIMKILGSVEDTKIFEIKNRIKATKRPSSNAYELKSTEERINALKELGYEPNDYYLCEAWLILEESSAETLIKEFFIWWYTPDLIGRLCTVAADGVDDVEPRLIEFRRIFTFLHLQKEIYLNKVWVITDGDDKGASVVNQLKAKFVKQGSWSEDQFIALDQPQFENYYPSKFAGKVEEINICNDTNRKKNLKKCLLESVLKWIKEDSKNAKQEFEVSAKEVIDILRKIENRLCKDMKSTRE